MTSLSPSADKVNWTEKGAILAQALPYMRMFNGRTFVVKLGGAAMVSERLSALFATDIVLLRQVGIHPIVVHGGGPQIEEMLTKLNIQSSFVDGLRITDPSTLSIVEMVLCGSINKSIVTSIQASGGTALGLSGKDANLITARKLSRRKRDPDSHLEKILDLGLVGEPERIDPKVFDTLGQAHIIPVVAPLGADTKGTTYNINADTAAGAIAAATGAARLFLLTDTEGVLDEDGKTISQLRISQAQEMIRNGTVSGGMIPKLETCFKALREGVEAAVIIDGRVPHALLLEIFTGHGVGTQIRA